jgi:hypothetical protein
MRRTSWTYRAPAQTGPDRVLRDRAVKLHETYPLLRLYLTRFAWGGYEVEQRARLVMLKWSTSAIRDCISDAAFLRVEPERYFRNLLPTLPEWVQPLLIAVVGNDPSTRALLPGLHVRDLTVPTGFTRQLYLLAALVRRRKPQALAPDQVTQIVPLRDDAIDRAWIRWISSARDTSDTRFDDLARAAQGFPTAIRGSRVKAILEGAGFQELKAADLLSRPIVERVKPVWFCRIRAPAGCPAPASRSPPGRLLNRPSPAQCIGRRIPRTRGRS